MRQYSFALWALSCVGGTALLVASPDQARADEDGDEPASILYTAPDGAQDPDDDEPAPAGITGKRTAQADAAETVGDKAPAAEPSELAPAAAPSDKAPAGEGAGESVRTGRAIDVNSRKKGVFGAYRVRVAYAHPTFDDGLKYYDKLYGTPAWYPEIAADWFAFDWYATLGIGLRMGYYTADGHAATCAGQAGAAAGKCKLDGITSDNIQQDPNGPTTLTLIPLQLLATFEFTPFDRKWVVVDGWIGVERLYYQEVRNQKAAATPAGTPPPVTTPTTTGTPPPDSTLTNTGWKNSSVVGVAANILLNPLDETSPDSMRQLGLGNVYLSPYVELIRTISKSGVSFGRSVYGIGFTFETVN